MNIHITEYFNVQQYYIKVKIKIKTNVNVELQLLNLVDTPPHKNK
jgi:hypothetical protein